MSGARSSAVLVALAAAAVLAPRAALANGRFPNAEAIRELGPNALVVSGTYGLLLSGNERDFQYVCESLLFGATLMGSWVDPVLEVLPDGTILSGSRNGLRVSRDFGCTFTSDWSLPHDPTFLPPDPHATGPEGQIVDLCPAYDASGGAIALTTVSNPDGSTLEHRLYRTTDGAKTWAALGVPIPTSSARVVLTVDVAPSDPARIYVSANSLGTSQMLVSRNGGASWTASDIPLADDGGVLGLYIAGVSPAEPDRVYLRASRQSTTSDPTQLSWDDSLLVSDDAGATARELLRKHAALLGFALSPDGANVLAGFGDPLTPPNVSAVAELGLYAASAVELAFTQLVPNLPVSCLRWTDTALYACATEHDPLGKDPSLHDFHLGRFSATGLPASSQDFAALLKLKDVRGPIPNADGEPPACSVEWVSGDPTNTAQPSVCTNFNACDTSSALSAGAFVCGAEVGGEGGAVGHLDAGGGVANAGQSGAGAVSGNATSGGSAAERAGDACGCRLVARSNTASCWLLSLVCIGALRAARKARRSRQSRLRVAGHITRLKTGLNPPQIQIALPGRACVQCRSRGGSAGNSWRASKQA